MTVVDFNRTKQPTNVGLDDLIAILNSKKNERAPKTVLMITTDGEGDVDYYIVGDYKVNTLLGDVELLKDFIKETD